MKKFVMIAAMLVLGLVGGASAQTPATQVHGSFVLANDKQLNVPELGKGFNVGAGIRLFDRFYLTEDFQRVSETQQFRQNGRTITNTTAAEYHFADKFFAKAGVEFSNYKDDLTADSFTSTRLQFGGGYKVLHEETELPTFQVDAVGFVSVASGEDTKGVRATAKTNYTLGNSPFALEAKVGATYLNFTDFSLVKRNRITTDFSVGLVLNITALLGY